VCCKKGSYHGRWACGLNVEKAVLLQEYIFWTGELGI